MREPTTPANKTLYGLWESWRVDREQYLQRTRDIVDVTLPYLRPDLEEGVQGEDLVRPFQSTGAKCVNNLSSKLVLALFPAELPFFRYDVDVQRFLQAGGIPDQLAELQAYLAVQAEQTQRRLEVSGFRAKAAMGSKHLLVAGNYLLQIHPDITFSGLRLDEFQIRRDTRDMVEAIITRKVVSRSSIEDPYIRKNAHKTTLGSRVGRDEVDHFVAYFRTGQDSWEKQEELGRIPLDIEEGISDLDMPFIPLRMIPDEGADYGRAYCEDYLGHLEVLDGITQSLTEGVAISCKTNPILEPGAMITPTELAEADNGQPLAGFRDKIQFLTAERHLQDMAFAAQFLAEVRSELREAFLLLTPRQAERVTAAEIFELQRQLNESLGDAFAILGDEWQLPVVRKVRHRMEKAKELVELPKLPGGKSVFSPRVITGLDAIGRTREEVQLLRFGEAGQQFLGAQFFEYIVPSEFLQRLAASESINPTGLVRSDQQVEQARQQQAGVNLLEKTGPKALDLVKQERERQAQ